MHPDVKDILTVLKSIVGDAKVAYLAVPVTSGKRLWDLARSLQCRDIARVQGVSPTRFEQEVLIPNLGASEALVSEIRKYESIAVNPAVTLVRGWQHADYMTLWTTVLRQSVAKIYLADGWEYSHGCLCEVDLAFSLGTAVYNLNRDALSRQACARIVNQAKESACDLDVSCLVGIFAKWEAHLE